MKGRSARNLRARSNATRYTVPMHPTPPRSKSAISSPAVSWSTSETTLRERAGIWAMPKLFVIAGAVLMGIGLLLWAGFPLGRLPGDFMVRRGPVTLYFPLVTSILVSIVLTLLMLLFRR